MKLIKKYLNPSGPIYSTIALPEVEVRPGYPRMPKESDYMSDEELAKAFAVPQEYLDAVSLRYLLNLYHTDYGKFKQEWERLHLGSTAEGRQAMKDLQAILNMTLHIHLGTTRAAKVGIPMMLGAVGAPIASSIGAVGNGLTALGTNFPMAVKGTLAVLAGLGLANFGSPNGVAKTGNKFSQDWTNFFGTRLGWTTDLLNPEGDRGWVGSFIGDLADVGLAAPYLRRFYNASNFAAERQAASLNNLNFFPEDFSKVEDLVKEFNPDLYAWLKAHPGYQVIFENPGLLRVLKTGPTEQSLQVKGPEGFKILTRLMGQTEGNKIAQLAKNSLAAAAASLKKLKKLPEEIRNRYLSALERHASEVLKDNYKGLDWSIDKVHTGMPIDKLLERRAIDEKWLTDYYNNVTDIMIPLEKLLRNSGDLAHGSIVNGNFVPGEGYWYGKMGGSYTRVNPYHYIVSRSPNFLRTNNIYTGYANELTSGIKFDNFLTSFPRANRKFSIYTVEGMGDNSLKLRNWYTNWTGGDGATGNSGKKAVRYLVPIIDLKNLLTLPLSGSTEGTSAGGPLINQIGRAPIIKFMGEDKGFYPVRINVYDSSVPDIKSWWNNFNFLPGTGPLAYKDNKTNNNNNLT